MITVRGTLSLNDLGYFVELHLRAAEHVLLKEGHGRSGLHDVRVLLIEVQRGGDRLLLVVRSIGPVGRYRGGIPPAGARPAVPLAMPAKELVIRELVVGQVGDVLLGRRANGRGEAQPERLLRLGYSQVEQAGHARDGTSAAGDPVDVHPARESLARLGLEADELLLVVGEGEVGSHHGGDVFMIILSSLGCCRWRRSRLPRRPLLLLSGVEPRRRSGDLLPRPPKYLQLALHGPFLERLRRGHATRLLGNDVLGRRAAAGYGPRKRRREALGTAATDVQTEELAGRGRNAGLLRGACPAAVAILFGFATLLFIRFGTSRMFERIEASREGLQYHLDHGRRR